MVAIKRVVNQIKISVKKLFCNHKFKECAKWTGRNTETGERENLLISYECVKCGKIIDIVF